MSKSKETSKRRPLRKLVLLAALVGALLLAVFYATCGHGFGLGGGGGAGLSPGSGKGRGTGSAPVVASDAATAAPHARCVLRVDATGIHLGGAAASVDEAAAVAACKDAGGADVLVTGDAVEGTWTHLKAALDAAGVPTYTTSPTSPTSPPPSR